MDVTDIDVVNTNFGVVDGGWNAGDFNGDRVTDVSDFTTGTQTTDLRIWHCSDSFLADASYSHFLRVSRLPSIAKA